MARLSDPPSTYPQWPVQYLLGCYARALEEARSASLLKAPTDQQALVETLTLSRRLAVSNAGFIITMEMFPQPPEAQLRGALQLFDSLLAAAGGTSSSSSSLPSFSPLPAQQPEPFIPSRVTSLTQVTPMPPAFLEDFVMRFADEQDLIAQVFERIVPALMKKLSVISALGDYSVPMSVLERLMGSKVVASALVRLPTWLPRSYASSTSNVSGSGSGNDNNNNTNTAAATTAENNQGMNDGRVVEFQTLLGTAFGISCIPDVAAHPLHPSIRTPDVVQQCFMNIDGQRPGDVRSSVASVQAAQVQIQGQLYRIMMSLLRNSDTREAALDWLTAAVRTNQERSKMRPDNKKAGTDGFMLNVVAVLLKMCEPFMDPATGKAWPRLDPRYVSDPLARGRCFEDDTRLGATSQAVAEWWHASAGGSGTSGDGTTNSNTNTVKYHFICECFFLTSMALRLGFAKSLETCSNVARSAHHYAEDAEGAPPHQVAAIRTVSHRLKGIAVTMEVCFKQEGFLNDVIGYYRLLTTYLIRVASPSAAAGGAPTLPLPDPPPMEFSSLPEFYVEDVCSALTWAGRARPDLVTASRMEQFMLFFSVFLGSPLYVRNPYLRGKMVEALASYMPQEDEADDWRPRAGVGRAAEEVSTLFQVHPLVIGNMVRALISLFVDIERTDRSNSFYEKFNMRYYIGEIMAYLWKLPPHRLAWREVAVNDPKLYIRFVNFILADSQHLLQEALETLPAVQETERLQEDGAAWNGLTPTERADREEALENHRRHLRNDFSLAEIYLKTMKFTSEDAVVATRFFDVQVRDRQARILDFFLRYLTVPAERRKLKLKNPENYGWRPKELIVSLAAIHANLYRTDRTAWADAVAADTDYYGKNPEILDELVTILRGLNVVAIQDITDVQALAAAAAAAVANAAAEEEAFDDVPDEFEDPLLGGIMLDPVKLPSGQIVNRPTILQQLLADQRDPFSRAPMTEDDLVECPELKGRVAAWVAAQKAKRNDNTGAGGGGGGGHEAMEED